MLNDIVYGVDDLLNDTTLRKTIFSKYEEGGRKNDKVFLNQFRPYICPKCGSLHFVYVGEDEGGLNEFECKDCGCKFNVLTGTVLAEYKKPIHEAYSFLSLLMTKQFLKDEERKTSRVRRDATMFRALSIFLVALSKAGAQFENDTVAIDVFSLPNVVKSFDYLKESDDLMNYVIGVAYDGEKVKMRFIGAGYADQQVLEWQYCKAIQQKTTLVHKDYLCYSSLVFTCNLKQKIDWGTDEEIKKYDPLLGRVIEMEDEFRKFIKYYDRDKTKLFLEYYFRIFEFVERASKTSTDKIHFMLTLLLNSNAIKRLPKFKDAVREELLKSTKKHS